MKLFLIQLYSREELYVPKEHLIAKLDYSELKALLKKLKYEEELTAQIEARQKKLLEIDAISKEEYDTVVIRVNTLSADEEFQQVQLEKKSVNAPLNIEKMAPVN